MKYVNVLNYRGKLQVNFGLNQLEGLHLCIKYCEFSQLI